MSCHWLDTAAYWAASIGSFFAVAVAIFGDYIRNLLLGPRITLSLLDPQGDLTKRGNGSRLHVFHLRVVNGRPRTAAKDVQIRVQRLSRKAAGGKFILENQVYPIPLAWTPLEYGEARRDVYDEGTCDFGFLEEGSPEFMLLTWGIPNNFRGRVKADDCVRFEIRAAGPNLYLSKPLYLEVAWDGEWTDKRDEIHKHLSIEPKNSLTD